ncbi:MAG: hypothetical protein WDL87_07925 [Candidatus Omnitrophota bacterium]|jgi:Flp pilus assembly pilin Flp
MFIRLTKRAQSTLEYAVIIAVVVGALIAMQVYVKRGLQGRLRQATDDVGDQFSPGNTNYHYVTNSYVDSDERSAGGSYFSNTIPTATTISNQSQNRTGNERVLNQTNEHWIAP